MNSQEAKEKFFKQRLALLFRAIDTFKSKNKKDHFSQCYYVVFSDYPTEKSFIVLLEHCEGESETLLIIEAMKAYILSYYSL